MCTLTLKHEQVFLLYMIYNKLPQRGGQRGCPVMGAVTMIFNNILYIMFEML